MPVKKYEILPHYPAEMIRMASEGRSMVQIAAHWKLPKKQVSEWGKENRYTGEEYQEFKAAYQVARTCFEAFWEDIGQKGTKGLLAKFNPGSWERIMKARCRDEWVEISHQKVTIDKDSVKDMTDDQLNQKLKDILEQINKNKKGSASSDQT